MKSLRQAGEKDMRDGGEKMKGEQKLSNSMLAGNAEGREVDYEGYRTCLVLMMEDSDWSRLIATRLPLNATRCR
ncbi:hypothetical protein EYF80_001665 [Liparis tanakae]|uniref:Uncharacterized protein n=1 Tax=Liparis tanakae TaxID=230148 RepID=A0A4Z2JE14_9TELE|nr:hypothetical protein EYF80_001665 [Liparis tanakae]